MIDTVLLFVIVFVSLLIGAIIISIYLAWYFAKKAPKIDIVQGKLKNECDIDIEDVIPFLKLTNLE